MKYISESETIKDYKRKLFKLKEKRLILIVCVIVAIALVALSFIVLKNNKNNHVATATTHRQTESNTFEDEFATEAITYNIDKPKVYNKKEINKILKEYSKKDNRFVELYYNRDKYTLNELNKAINNPEMAAFIIGYRNGKKGRKATEGLNKNEIKQKCPLLIQWDDRWGYEKYGEDNIGFSGCGPTCFAMVAYSLTRDPSFTPFKVARFSKKHGYYIKNQGTTWEFFNGAAKKYKLKIESLSLSEKEYKKALKKGKLLILSVSQGDFTNNGHFVVVYGYNKNGFKVNDPVCRARSNRTYSFDRLAKQTASTWAFGKGK